jgi:hypothetical protein
MPPRMAVPRVREVSPNRQPGTHDTEYDPPECSVWPPCPRPAEAQNGADGGAGASPWPLPERGLRPCPTFS